MHELSPRPLLALGATCRRLLQLSRDPELWTSLTIDWQAIKAQEEKKNKCLDSAMRRATKLRKLTIKNRTFEQIKSGVVAAVAKRAGSGLKTLIFSAEASHIKQCYLRVKLKPILDSGGVEQLCSSSSVLSLKPHLPGVARRLGEDCRSTCHCLPCKPPEPQDARCRAGGVFFYVSAFSHIPF